MITAQQEEQIISLIELITWYRDNYHNSDFGHTDSINELNGYLKQDVLSPGDLNKIEMMEIMTDGWLDGPPDID